MTGAPDPLDPARAKRPADPATIPWWRAILKPRSWRRVLRNILSIVYRPIDKDDF